ncbi:hypothetical protein KEM54_005440 [Ascosphaera aggregata]|nr:hypothetical protein KEM54_005440 [Ascosphaera aggregata]
MMDQDNRMVTSDVDHGDDDDIEIDVDLPQPQQHDPYNQDAMIDDVSVISEHLEDADMVDDDGHYVDEDINDESMEYYDEEDLDAPIEDAPEEQEHLPDEDMAPVGDEMEQPQQQEMQVPFAQHQPSSLHADAIVPLHHGATTAVEPSIVGAQHAYIEHTSETTSSEIKEAHEQPEATHQEGLEHEAAAAPEAEQPKTADEGIRSPSEPPTQTGTGATFLEEQTGDVLDAAVNFEGDSTEELAEDEVKLVESYHVEHAEDQEALSVPQDDESQQAERERGPEDEHQQDHSVADAYLALHNIKVIYQESEIYLFPPPESDPNDTFFLKDETIAGQPMGELLRACRDVLGAHITPQEDLFLEIDRLGLYFVEIVELYLHLSANDDVNVPEPMYIALHSRLNANSEFANLQEAVQKGQGLSYFEIYEEEEFESPGVEDAPADQDEDQHYVEEEEEGKEGEAADVHSKRESQIVPKNEVEDGDIHEYSHADEEEAQEKQPLQEIVNEEGNLQDATVSAAHDLSRDIASGKAAPPQSLNDLPAEAAPDVSGAEASPRGAATSSSPTPQSVEDHHTETTSQDAGVEQTEVEHGYETEDVDHEPSQEPVSDLGNQTIAEYEGAEYIPQDGEPQGIDDYAAEEDPVDSFTESAKESTTIGAVPGSVAEGGHDQPEQGNHEVQEPIGQEHDSVSTNVYNQGLDSFDAETEFDAETIRDPYQPEEMGENGTGEDEHSRSLEEPEANEEARTDEREDEYREADSDSMPEEPLEGFDNVFQDGAHAINDDLEAVATDNKVLDGALLNGNVSGDFHSDEGAPVSHDGTTSDASYEEEEGLLGHDTVAPETYDDLANAENFEDHEDHHDQSDEFDKAAVQGGETAETAIVVVRGVEEDDVASVKRLREGDEVEEADAKRRRS